MLSTLVHKRKETAFILNAVQGVVARKKLLVLELSTMLATVRLTSEAFPLRYCPFFNYQEPGFSLLCCPARDGAPLSDWSRPLSNVTDTINQWSTIRARVSSLWRCGNGIGCGAGVTQMRRLLGRAVSLSSVGGSSVVMWRC